MDPICGDMAHLVFIKKKAAQWATLIKQKLSQNKRLRLNIYSFDQSFSIVMFLFFEINTFGFDYFFS